MCKYRIIISKLIDAAQSQHAYGSDLDSCIIGVVRRIVKWWRWCWHGEEDKAGGEHNGLSRRIRVGVGDLGLKIAISTSRGRDSRLTVGVGFESAGLDSGSLDESGLVLGENEVDICGICYV